MKNKTVIESLLQNLCLKEKYTTCKSVIQQDSRQAPWKHQTTNHITSVTDERVDFRMNKYSLTSSRKLAASIYFRGPACVFEYFTDKDALKSTLSKPYCRE